MRSAPYGRRPVRGRSADDPRRRWPGQGDLNDCHRFAAKRIVGNDRPQHECAEESRKRDRDGLRQRCLDRSRKAAPAFGFPAERRA
jgi:hypothetical protein